MLIFLMMTIFLTSFMFMQMKHPLAMGLMLLIQTFLISMVSGMFMKTFWFSYVLFLIFMGGMLVLFIYVTSLSSNEMFSMSMKLLFMSIISLFFTMMISFIMDNSLTENFINNHEMIKLFNNENLIYENIISLNKMYNFPTNLITLILINYLFLTLLMTVKITKKNYGPLRPMN
uniref:NADH-ubiquinone oxidoreductase chain 6 n=1 Tax=Uranotaenia geometrica TaxID=2597066 RepID=A0A5B9H7L9_9DIPT|nr:NADH dehydrogenase subunit 6 [Uranotaenia geometrica]QEE94447.1 NADH dehydrogenase subunit 6 [Uranotaenia geometrica]